jgi:DNA repair protein RecN (Recombination protein N)
MATAVELISQWEPRAVEARDDAGDGPASGLLRELRVRDLVLVDEAQVRFGPGLNLLTGETGSGKSLIVDALGLALGARASAEQVRQGAKRALAEAWFEGAAGERVLGREVGRRGGARIDGMLVSVGELDRTGRGLVAIHGQHEQQTLLDPDAQAALLDGHAGALEVRAAVAAAHAGWRDALERLAALERTLARGRREEEYLRWQLEELRAADPQPGEDERLLAERSVVRHASRLAELTEAALAALRDEGLAVAAGSMAQAAGLDPRLGELSVRLEALAEEAGDAAVEVRRYADAIDADPGRLEELEGRLNVLDQLKRKHGGTLDSVLSERARLEGELGRGEDLEEVTARARGEVEAARDRLASAATRLSRLRRRGAARLGTAVTRELRGLRLQEAVFEVRLVPRPEPGPDGAEQVEMLFSANPGEPPASLARVASGGELSRVMLAIETVGAESSAIPTLVFDEVDAGIGGETALEVGRRLKVLGDAHQVLVVTHLAQIACFADHHLVVEKAPGRDGRNVVRVRELTSQEERAEELARMMSGRVTEKAVARARELLEEARPS